MRAGVGRPLLPTYPEHKSTPILAKVINLRKDELYITVQGWSKAILDIYGKQDKAKILFVC